MNMESLFIGTAIIIGLYVCITIFAFIFGFSWATVWFGVLKPVGKFLRKHHILIPALLAVFLFLAFWLFYNNTLNERLTIWLFAGGIMALCGLIAWFVFDVVAGPRDKRKP